ncbi:MAG: TetR/AcrR family transcriptional regulator [Myxococcota bacterium]|nr:TetR/AcrR family transcriptional regulator [Myxococcota bacterium]
MTSSSNPLPQTRWGDRVGRRRDILRAAADLLGQEGYDRLSVRAIAQRAGISPATLYSYFPNKGEIFATLMVQRFADLRMALDQLGPAALQSVEALVMHLMPELVDLYRHFGRHIHEWTRGEVEHSPTVASTKQAFVDATTALEHALQIAARNQGIALDRGPAVMPYVWSTLFGIADHHGTNMPGTLGYQRDELTRYAARALARGLTSREGCEAG